VVPLPAAREHLKLPALLAPVGLRASASVCGAGRCTLRGVGGGVAEPMMPCGVRRPLPAVPPALP
tara:strand:+ start:414 stop:608 length:195 start_codon:yes stop_codon:yes gene_type:complete